MGVYRAAIVTESGQNLIAQALAKEKPLIFTSAKTSSYSYPVGTNVPALTGLQDVVQSVMPFDSKVLGGNVAQVSVRFDNDGVDQTYRIETIGLYAKIEGGTETLFSVTQATTPDEMPVQSDVSPSAYIYNIQHTVQNASQITLTVNPAGTATVQDIMDIESPEFDDSGTVEGISSFPSFLETMKSKMNFFQFFRNLKAGLQFVLHAGQIVNNCVTDNAGLPLSAAQGKVLKDLYTQLYSEMGTILQYSHTSDTPFDFNDKNAKAGFHRLGTENSFKNAPSGVNPIYSNVLVVRNNAWDTLSMTIYLYTKGTNSSVVYKTGNTTDWANLSWSVYATKSDLYPSYNRSILFSNLKADVTDQSITITEDGMVQAVARTQAIVGTAFVRFVVNNTVVYEGHTVSGTYRYLWTPIFPVKKGDVIKVTLETTTADGQRFVYFYKS